MTKENYETDPIPYRFVRKVKSASFEGISIQQKPNTTPDDWKIVAMPLDTFVALANNSYFATTPANFSYNELDVTWTAVPIPSRLLGQSHLAAYLYSFLSSDAWSGTTSYKVITRRDGPDNKKYQMNEFYMPVINGVDIPGPKNICMVLIDETSPNCPATIPMRLRDVAIAVPVWRGPNAVVPISSWPIWDRFWRTDNIEGIRRDSVFAFNELCTRLGVSDACGTALSLLAELYGQWYYGIAPVIKKDSVDPDYEKSPYGSWTYDGSPLDKTNSRNIRS